MEELGKHAGLPLKNAKGNHEKMKSDEHIPRKLKAGQDAESNGGRPKKHCAKCAHFLPSIKHTHNTKDCTKWNKDGAPMQKGKGGYHQSKGNYANAAAELTQSNVLKQCFVQMKKEQKALEKLILKQGRKRRKRLKHHVLVDSGDSSDDSD